MNAQALICNAQQEFSLERVKLAELGSEDILVRTQISGVSIGTEFALIRNKLSWGPYPICPGYQAVGEVEKVGDDVTDFAPGDTVYYRTQKPFTLQDGAAVSPTCATHCSHAVIAPSDTHGPARLPDGVSAEAAGLFVMPSVALYGADMAGVSVGETVVVQGVGLIGLGSVAVCMLRGAKIIAVDVNAKRLELAKQLGASHLVNASEADPVQAVSEITGGGADVVIEATGETGLLDTAIQMARTNGKFIFQGNYGAGQMSLKFLEAHRRRLRAFFPCDDGYAPYRSAVMRMMQNGVLAFEKTITHRIAAGESADFYRAINRGEVKDVCGAIIQW
jgi:L-iditol 2-dehydrogenase